MKKLSTTIALVALFMFAFSGSAFAWGVTAEDDPFAQGKWFLGLSSGMDFGMGTDTYEPEDGDEVETDVMEFDLGLAGGYYVLKGWEVGLAFRYDYTKVTDEDDNAVSSGEYMAGIQTGYYYATPIPVHPFINVEFGYAGQFTNYEPDQGDETSNTAGGFAMRPSIGAVLFFSNEMALTPAIYYQYASYSGTDDTTGTEFDYDSTSSRFGFQLGLTGIF